MARFREPAHYMREWRHAWGYSLRELAERSGISLSVLSRAETGTSLYTQALLEALADVYGVTARDLLFPPNIRIVVEGNHTRTIRP